MALVVAFVLTRVAGGFTGAGLVLPGRSRILVVFLSVVVMSVFALFRACRRGGRKGLVLCRFEVVVRPSLVLRVVPVLRALLILLVVLVLRALLVLRVLLILGRMLLVLTGVILFLLLRFGRLALFCLFHSQTFVFCY
jgi:hypothetical protein